LPLHLCNFGGIRTPRCPTCCCSSQGRGKDGFIAHESLCLISPYHHIRGMTWTSAPPQRIGDADGHDILEILDKTRYRAKMKNTSIGQRRG
jgi:hypothetical protein